MNSSSRPSWDEYFLGIALAVSKRADCSRRQVGAIIVKHHRIVATGYNGAPSGHGGCSAGYCPRAKLENVEPGLGYDNCIAIHAEANALLYADRDNCEGATLYCTDTPCVACWKLIRGSGVKHVISGRP